MATPQISKSIDMTVLVTGGAGFIGSYVVEELVNLGYKVVVLDNLSGGFQNNVVDQATFVLGSVNDTTLVQSLFRQYKFDYVFHLAAYAAEGLSHFIRKFTYENNVLGSVTLINAAVNFEVKCFVFTSSIAVYGTNQLPLHEELFPLPEDPYGVAKLAVEQDLRIAFEMFGMPFIVFRPHNVYGERQNTGDKYRNVIGIFMNQILQGKPMTIFGDGSQTRAFSYIRDIAPIIARTITVREAYNQIINIGSDDSYSVNELARAVASAMGVEAEVEYLEQRNEILHAFASHQKLRRIFGSSELTPLDTGLQRMASWVKHIGSRASEDYKEIEIWKNLPESWIPQDVTEK